MLELLPHRYPFLLIDRVVELEQGKNLSAIKNVSISEPFFQGHFPENPVMPGVLQIEAMAQVGGILINQMQKKEKSSIKKHPQPSYNNMKHHKRK